MTPELESLDAFCKSIYESHQSINAGGCGVFASLVGNRLSKVAKVKIRVTDMFMEDKKLIPSARKNIKKNTLYEWNMNGVSFGHIIVEFLYKKKTYYVDATGVHQVASRCCFGWPMYTDPLTLKEVDELSGVAKGWNQSFDRRAVPAIKRKVDKFFSKHIKAGKLLAGAKLQM